MQLFKSVREVVEYRKSCQKNGLSIGIVPTMGALHSGHLSLVDASARLCDTTIVSIFVNPIQFNNATDLAKYPRTLERDLELLSTTGCKAVFAPDEHEMYTSPPLLKMNFGSLEQVMEGASRPGHFSGVGVVVSKLFNILQPDHAFFGQKDLQQFLVIKRLVQDLSFQLTLHCCPTQREADGLALSSRNVRLSKENRPVAGKIYQSLLLAAQALPSEGVVLAKKKALALLQSEPLFQTDYFEIAHADSLTTIQEGEKYKEVAICTAVYLDGVRLIDNLLVD
jgi:pantoate--beta-alanine ligase